MAQTALDQAITAAAAAEATYVADSSTVANINVAIAAATSPLSAAEAQVAADAAVFNTSLQALSAAALAAQVAVPSAPAPSTLPVPTA